MIFRVIHCPFSVGGNPVGLSRHLRKLGIHSSCLVREQNSFAYSVDRVLWNTGDNSLVKMIRVLKAIIFVARNFDIIHFNYGTTISCPVSPWRPGEPINRRLLRLFYSFYTLILQWLELSLYKVLGRPMFVHFQGDDARQGDYIKRNYRYNIASQVDQGYYNKISDRFKRFIIKRLAKNCDQVYAVNPDLLNVLPFGSKFVPYSHIALDEWLPVYTHLEKRPLTFGHAPTHRAVKGTAHILEAMELLSSEGYSFNVDLIEGLRNEEAKKKYEKIDVLVDQLYAGWYGGLAVEAMALGKPVVVYIREVDLKHIPLEMQKDLPVIRTDVENIANTLRWVIEMPREDLLNIAKKSRKFVEKWHDPLDIARTISKDYREALIKRGKK